MYFLRTEKEGTHSIERLFRTVRTAMPRDINTTVAMSRFSSRGIWRRLYNTVEAAFRQGDVNHITGYIHYVAVLLRKKKTVLTIHDLGTVYRLSGFRRKVFLFLWYWLPIRRSAIVTVISEATKRELLHYVKVAPEKIRVVPDCVSEAFRPAPQEFHGARPTILQVGTKPNKNLERLGKALRGLPCRVRVIGKLTEEQSAVLRQNQIEYSSVSNLPDAEVVEEYRRCDMVVFVSTYEGFGLPILEAQATGRPVVTSSVSSMPEVAGNAACLVDPFDVESIRDGILKVIADPQYRNELVQRGMENVKRFQPGAIAARYAEIYRELAGRMSAHSRDEQSQRTAMAGQ